MSIKKAYYYLFYKMYKFSEAAPSRWLSDWKAELAIDILEGLLSFSLFVYYTVHIDRHFKMPENYKIIGLYIIIIGLPNYFIFHHRDQWKGYVHKFDLLPKWKNRLGGWIIFVVVLLIISNLVFAFYEMSQIDWKAYK